VSLGGTLAFLVDYQSNLNTCEQIEKGDSENGRRIWVGMFCSHLNRGCCALEIQHCNPCSHTARSYDSGSYCSYVPSVLVSRSLLVELLSKLHESSSSTIDSSHVNFHSESLTRQGSPQIITIVLSKVKQVIRVAVYYD